MTKFEINIFSFFEKDEIIAEIYWENKQWAQITHENKGLVAQFYSHPKEKAWEFPLSEAIAILEQAKSKLLSRISGQTPISEDDLDPEFFNKESERIIMEIMAHPKKKTIQTHLGRFGKVEDTYAPDLGGVRQNLKGEFIGFLEPEVT